MNKFLNLLFILINCYFISSYAMDHKQIISVLQEAYFESVEKIIPLIQSSQVSDFKAATCITLDTINEKMAIGFYDGTVQIRSQKDNSLIESTLQYARNNVKSIHFMPYQKETPNSIIVEQSSSEASVLTFSQYPQIITDNDRSVILERPIRTISFNPTQLLLFLQNTDEHLIPYFCSEKNEWKTNSAIQEPNVNIVLFTVP